MTKEQTILITPQGYLALETELNDLKLNKRPEVIAALQEARSLGDLSENAEYDAARNEQAQVEARIKELEFKLEHCQVMDGNSKDTVSVGSSVVLNYIDDDEEESLILSAFERANLASPEWHNGAAEYYDEETDFTVTFSCWEGSAYAAAISRE